MKTIISIDVQAKEWFDKVNGNSYFSGTIHVNYLDGEQRIFFMPFQYGYGDYYLQETYKRLNEHNVISGGFAEFTTLRKYCNENNIELNAIIQKDCKKSELKQIEKDYNNSLELI